MSNPITFITDYVRSSIAELKKVTWPTKEMTIRYTAMVVIVSVSLAAFFAVLDFSFSKLMTTVLAQKISAPTPTAQPAPAPVIPELQTTSATATTPDQNGNLKLDLNGSATSVK
jgi:preprotein translocase SecE subunit